MEFCLRTRVYSRTTASTHSAAQHKWNSVSNSHTHDTTRMYNHARFRSQPGNLTASIKNTFSARSGHEPAKLGRFAKSQGQSGGVVAQFADRSLRISRGLFGIFKLAR